MAGGGYAVEMRIMEEMLVAARCNPGQGHYGVTVTTPCRTRHLGPLVPCTCISSCLATAGTPRWTRHLGPPVAGTCISSYLVLMLGMSKIQLV